MLVAWSPIRSRFLATNSRWAQARDRARIAHHVGQQFAEQAVVVLVDLVVAGPDGDGAVDLGGGVGVQHVLQPHRHQLAHALDRAGQRRASARPRPATRARLAMFLARSPVRSRSSASFIAATVRRRSDGHRLAQGDQADGLASRCRAACASSLASRSTTARARATSRRATASMASATWASARPPMRATSAVSWFSSSP